MCTEKYRKSKRIPRRMIEDGCTKNPTQIQNSKLIPERMIKDGGNDEALIGFEQMVNTKGPHRWRA